MYFGKKGTTQILYRDDQGRKKTEEISGGVQIERIQHGIIVQTEKDIELYILGKCYNKKEYQQLFTWNCTMERPRTALYTQRKN